MHDFARVWKSEMKDDSALGKRKFNSIEGENSVTCFPFPRRPFSYEDVESKFGSSVLVPVGGIGTSHLSQIVPCDLLSGDRKDYFPTVLLAEILSRAEGPLYCAIRGQGYMIYS